MLACLLFILQNSQAQNGSSRVDFDAPVDFKMALSGTFGELRSNHFHAGIDIKTFGAINKPLYAIANGHVSRVVVSPGGYGKAVYIEHPNGYTSVYAHCNKFTGELADWVKEEQYRLQSFRVNLFPEPGQFKVRKGEIIAYSGNSGSSLGPHVHFEIRKTIGQIPVNPLQFGFKVKDFIRPKITGMRIYPVTSYSLINGKNEIYEADLAGWGPDYRIKNHDTLQLSGEFYFGINAYDRLNDSRNRNGVYEVELMNDSNRVYSHRMDEFSFSETRYVNSLIDYKTYQNLKRRYQKTYVEPNNKLSVYDSVFNEGIFMFIDEKYHVLKYVIRDIFDNESVLTFTVKSSPPAFTDVFTAAQKNHDKTFFEWSAENTFETSDFSIKIPAGALYDTLTFQYSESLPDEGFYSALHSVHKDSKAIHKSCEIRIKPHEIPEKIMGKALIAKVEDDELSSAGGMWDGVFMKTSIRQFGDYAIVVDTIPPELRPLNFRDGKNMSGMKVLKVAAKDELAGIDSYEATLNGEWLLMEWDPKNDLLLYSIDERLKSGKNTFRLIVTDGVGNETALTAILIR